MARRKKNRIDLKEWIDTHGTDFVVKVRDGKPYISRKAKRNPTRKKSDAEQKQVNVFRDAVKYAKSVLEDEEKKKKYADESTRTGRSVYHLAISDYIDKNSREPADTSLRLKSIEADDSGGHIFLKMNFAGTANFKKIELALFNAEGAFVENGTAEQASKNSWWYPIIDTSILTGKIRVVLTVTTRDGDVIAQECNISS